MKKRLLSALLSLSLAGMLTAGCGTQGEAGTAGENTGAAGTATENSDETAQSNEDIVKLKWYMAITPVERDFQEVMEELNKYTREKIGVEVECLPMSSSDYSEKMPTYINSGEAFDICFTAEWTTNYQQFVSKGAFMDITELVQTNAKETYDFIPQEMWDAVKLDGKIYGIPSYKEMGTQGGIMINTDMAEAYGIDLSGIKTLEDLTPILKTVKEKSLAEGKDVIGISNMSYNGGFGLVEPSQSLAGKSSLPVAAVVPEFGNFEGEEAIFNPYASQDFMDYCMLSREWFNEGYTSGDPVQYDGDMVKRDNDFKTGNLFSYLLAYAPGHAESLAASTGHGTKFIPFTAPLFESRSALGGLLAVSSTSEHPDKALEFLNLLNTDEYVGTLVRHGIEGKHHIPVGDTQVDRTLGGKVAPGENGYDYVFGWQFGTVFNQKWDISYPDNIEQMFLDYNKEMVVAPYSGFAFDIAPVENEISAITNVTSKYSIALQTGMVDPATTIPEFLKELEVNGSLELMEEVKRQIAEWEASK